MLLAQTTPSQALSQRGLAHLQDSTSARNMNSRSWPGDQNGWTIHLFDEWLESFQFGRVAIVLMSDSRWYSLFLNTKVINQWDKNLFLDPKVRVQFIFLELINGPQTPESVALRLILGPQGPGPAVIQLIIGPQSVVLQLRDWAWKPSWVGKKTTQGAPKHKGDVKKLTSTN